MPQASLDMTEPVFVWESRTRAETEPEYVLTLPWLPSSSQTRQRCLVSQHFGVLFNQLEPQNQGCCANRAVLDRVNATNNISDPVWSEVPGWHYLEYLGMLFRLSLACKYLEIVQCSDDACNVFKKRLESVIPTCEVPRAWREFHDWALQIAACICSKIEKEPGWQPKLPGLLMDFCSEWPGLHPIVKKVIPIDRCDTPVTEGVAEGSTEGILEIDQEYRDWTAEIELPYVLGVMSWLNGIATGEYAPTGMCRDSWYVEDCRPENHESSSVYDAAVIEAEERITTFNLCPNRVYAITRCLPDAELNLPALIPPYKDGLVPPHNHKYCSSEFCEESVKNFTSVEQAHACWTKEKNDECLKNCGGTCHNDCRKKCRDHCQETKVKFEMETINEASSRSVPTAWRHDNISLVDRNQPFMAVSHVWADGTGAGTWPAGTINKCLIGMFQQQAEELGCEGVWWDTICIPTTKKDRTAALNRMHLNYSEAKVTIVHDLYLKNFEPPDDDAAALAIVLSPWFTRGWTALELAKSKKVKVLFKDKARDLDDILAQPGRPSSPHGQVASTVIRNLRKEITTLNGLLTALRTRHTSWSRDRAIIAGLLVGVEDESDVSLQLIYQKILQTLGKIDYAHLFHTHETMTNVFTWCPPCLLDLPVARQRAQLKQWDVTVAADGSVCAHWEMIEIDDALVSKAVWKIDNRFLQRRLRLAVKRKSEHVVLYPPDDPQVSMGLVVKIDVRKDHKDAPVDGSGVRCQYIGPIYFQTYIGVNEVKSLGQVLVTIGGLRGKPMVR